MAWLVPEGSRFLISTTFAAATNVTAITNAANAVAAATNTYTVGDELLPQAEHLDRWPLESLERLIGAID